MTLTVLILLILFYWTYFVLDAWHDCTQKKDKDYAVRAQGKIAPSLKREYLEESLKYNKRWHAIDAGIKAYVIGFATYMTLGISWWVLILAYNAVALRYFFFNLATNWFSGNLPWYTGTVSKTDILTPKKPIHQILIKVAAVCIGVGLIIFYWYKTH